VGYIVGIRIAALVFIGGVISWWIAIPAYIAATGVPEGSTGVDLGYGIWSSQIRYLGVGAMVVGGLWALIDLRQSIGFAVRSGIKAVREKVDASQILRTERDTPMSWVIIAIGVMIIPVFIIYLRLVVNVPISALMAILMVIAGFLFSAVAGYMAGLVGSSNNPISGVTIATILTSALILLALMGSGAERGPAAAIMIGAVVCCAAAIAGDNMQDLKAGNILGATPQRQQIMQMVGVVSAALVLPLVLQLLLTGYGFGPPTAENPDALAAPQEAVALLREERHHLAVLVPLDGSDRGNEVLPMVADLASRHGAPVVLLKVGFVEPAPVDFPMQTVPPPQVTEEELAAAVEPARRQLEAAGVTVRVQSSWGLPAGEIIDASQEPGTLLVMTTHGRSGLDRWLLGSVAEKVLRHSTCPVLLKRVAAFEGKAP